jgi:hypothetical protein
LRDAFALRGRGLSLSRQEALSGFRDRLCIAVAMHLPDSLGVERALFIAALRLLTSPAGLRLATFDIPSTNLSSEGWVGLYLRAPHAPRGGRIHRLDRLIICLIG